jgi:DNA-binding IclR family transcriptional regulator
MVLRLRKTSNANLVITFYSRGMGHWSFLTNHAQVLVCIARDPAVRLRDIAARLGITERTAYGIVTELEEAGYLTKEKTGRRNRYELRANLPLRTSVAAERTIGDVLDLLVTADARRQLL